MEKFIVQKTNNNKYYIARRNDFTEQYERLDNKEYSTRALAEKAAQFARALYDEENSNQENGKGKANESSEGYSIVEQVGQYKTFTEKTIFFHLEQVNNLSELNTIIERLCDNSALRFRGVNEAKYRMTSSLQRYDAAKGHRIDFIGKLLRFVKNDNQIQEYFKDNNISINDLSCIALMQHYTLPTPMIDFTTDISIALSFAAQDSKNKDNHGWETEEYVSLYYFSLEEENEIRSYIQRILNNDKKNGVKYAEDYKRTDGYLDDSLVKYIEKNITWESLSEMEIVFVENQTWAERVATAKGETLNLNNPNLIRQKGCFVLNNYSNEELPLEENWIKHSRKCRDQFLSIPNNYQKYPFSGLVTYNPIHCIDIKKDVIKKWFEMHPMDPYDHSNQSEELKKVLHDILNTIITVR